MEHLSLTEVFGFITGAVCVWLTVKEHLWNWPIGIANNVFFIALFWQTRLYADMGLQFVYIVLGALSWYWWLHGGQSRSPLRVSCVPVSVALGVALLSVVSTFGMTLYLQRIHDAAPFWDALTTVLSLAAQYLLTRKWLENWWVWLTADAVYIGLYGFKHLYLTGALYALFLGMCVIGLKQWRKSLAEALPVPGEALHG